MCWSTLVVFSGFGGCICVLWLYFQSVEDVFEYFGCVFRVWRMYLCTLVVFSECGGCV